MGLKKCLRQHLNKQSCNKISRTSIYEPNELMDFAMCMLFLKHFLLFGFAWFSFFIYSDEDSGSLPSNLISPYLPLLEFFFFFKIPNISKTDSVKFHPDLFQISQEFLCKRTPPNFPK